MKTPTAPPTLSQDALLPPRIWKESTTDATPLVWSPNGRYAAYVLKEQRDNPKDWERESLCCIRADGRDARRLYSIGTPQIGRMGKDGVFNQDCAQIAPGIAGWCPNSQRILFWMYYPHAGSANADGSPLFDIPATGGKPRLLTTPVRGDNSMMRSDEDRIQPRRVLTFSPDGKYLLLVVGGGRWFVENKRIACLAYPSGKRLWMTDPEWAAISPAWSPDGRFIAFTMTPTARELKDSGEIWRRWSRMRLWITNAKWNLAGVHGNIMFQLTNDPRFRDSDPHWVTVMTNGKLENWIRFIRCENTDLTGNVAWGSRRSLWEVRHDGSGLRKVRSLPPEPLM